jgi:hypothetical protein
MAEKALPPSLYYQQCSELTSSTDIRQGAQGTVANTDS